MTSGVCMKNKFCDSSFEILKETCIPSVEWCHKISFIPFAVINPADERLIEIYVIRITYDGDFEIAHNPSMLPKTKTNYSSAIRSQTDSCNMKSALQCASQTFLCSTTTKGLMVASKFTRKKPPHRFDPILPYWALNTRTRGLVRAQFL